MWVASYGVMPHTTGRRPRSDPPRRAVSSPCRRCEERRHGPVAVELRDGSRISPHQTTGASQRWASRVSAAPCSTASGQVPAEMTDRHDPATFGQHSVLPGPEPRPSPGSPARWPRSSVEEPMSRGRSLFIAAGAAGLLMLTVTVALAAVTLSPKEQLGKAIFFDQNLSLNGNRSCASCHDSARGFTGPISAINLHGVVYEGS